MKRLFIATTDTVENGKVQEYYGVVSAHLVAGTGFLSDFAAGISDIIGGRSKTYRRHLESLYDEALDELSEKAYMHGCNGILGLKIDLDNISSKGMSMFMISAVGTAVKIKFEVEEHVYDTSNAVTSIDLNSEVEKRRILSILNNPERSVLSDTWEAILKSPDDDYVLPLTNKLFEIASDPLKFDSEMGYEFNFKNNYSSFMELIDRDLVIKGIKEGLEKGEGVSAARRIMKYYSLFDADCILKILEEGSARQAISLLGFDQPSYSETDLHKMEALIETFELLPDRGKIEVVKGGVFSKEEEKYICPSGHKNNPDVEFCSTCGDNIKGLDKEEIKAIKRFKKKVAVLKDLLSN